MDNNAPVIDTKKNAAKFYKVVETYIKRDGINDLMDWLGSTDFFEAPASTRFHGSYEGGLCQHSLNVGKWLNKLAEGLYPGQYTKETLTLVALFHDVCKANCYKTSTRNVKNEQTGQWEKVPFFAFAQHISVVYREKICGPNPMAYIYVQDLEFRKTSSRLDLSLEDDKTKWTRPIKAFDMDAAIAATSAQKANYSGTVVCGNDSVKYIYKFGTVDHNYIDHFGFMGVAPLYGYWDGSMNNSGFDVIAHGQSIASNLIEEITGRKRHPSMNHLIGELIILNAPKDKFRVTADKSSLDKSDKTWSLIISDIKANSILPACKTDAGTLRDMYAMYAKRCSSCGLRFVRNYSVGSSTGTKAPAIIEVVLPDNSIGYYLLMCKANETKSGPSLRDAMPLISSMLMMESNGKRVLGAYFVADRFSNGFVQDVSRLVEPINRNRTDRFEIRVCDTNTPLVLAVPAVSAQAAPVNINVGITIKKTR